MGQAKSPETQVGSSVGNTTKTVFNGVDGLVDCYIPKVKLPRGRESTHYWALQVIYRFTNSRIHALFNTYYNTLMHAHTHTHTIIYEPPVI